MYGKCVVIENVLDIHFFIEKRYWIFMNASSYCKNRNGNKHFHHRIVFHFSACSFCIISPLISKKFNNHYLPMPEVIDFELINYEKVLLSNFFNFFGSFVDISLPLSIWLGGSFVTFVSIYFDWCWWWFCGWSRCGSTPWISTYIAIMVYDLGQ